ncbi:LANO_0H06832g1_1 [Lachancea nothofagi CBS 11611]|uniref:LANO_0H06832g1_1 n=1 Tax=Lachancea nothofagi CBS 11611 TaxID=1266666 RepID=A0A1G4KLJ3_9SACH|nr:LANO_0H06832g1_1 [Lachancea nothofagi CBS 11611]
MGWSRAGSLFSLPPTLWLFVPESGTLDVRVDCVCESVAQVYVIERHNRVVCLRREECVPSTAKVGEAGGICMSAAAVWPKEPWESRMVAMVHRIETVGFPPPATRSSATFRNVCHARVVQSDIWNSTYRVNEVHWNPIFTGTRNHDMPVQGDMTQIRGRSRIPGPKLLP